MTSDELRELAARVAHDMPVSEVRDVLPGVLLAAAAHTDELRKCCVPPEWYVPGGGPMMLHRDNRDDGTWYASMQPPFGYREDGTWTVSLRVAPDGPWHRGAGRTAREAMADAEAKAKGGEPE